MQEKYITLSWSFIRDKRTTMSEKIILMEINNLSMLDKGCIANNSHFAKLMDVKNEAVSRLINSLLKKEYITVDIAPGSRNHHRVITINKMLFDPKQIVNAPLTKCSETKENITINITTKYKDFISQVKSAVPIKSKVTSTKEGKKLFTMIKDVERLIKDYKAHQLEKGEFAKRITPFMEDYGIENQSAKTTGLLYTGARI